MRINQNLGTIPLFLEVQGCFSTLAPLDARQAFRLDFLTGFGLFR